MSIITWKHDLCEVFVTQLSVAILVERFDYVCALTNRGAGEIMLVEEDLDVVGADSFFASGVDATEGRVWLERRIEAEWLAVLLNDHFCFRDCV